jgi:hypothetical protein
MAVSTRPSLAVYYGKGELMITIVERTQGHYDVQEVEFGRVYRWCPECVVVDCDCGERLTLTASSTAVCCRCGADHTTTFRAELAAERLGDEVLHPWRYAEDRKGASLPC